MPMNKIKVYTDGSCLGNPGPGGWAFLVIEKTDKQLEKIIYRQSDKEYSSTNNRMEMQAILMSLKYLHKNFPQQQVELFSDSNLLVQTINKGWKKKANRDLWQEIDQLLPNLKLKVNWVKAHHKDQYNNECDQLAWNEATKAQKEIKKNPALAKALVKQPAQATLF